jgi:hypothetical protein
MGKSDGKRPLGRRSRSREDKIKFDLGGMDWIELAQDAVKNLRVP